MGSNMAENHPVAFRWPMKAKINGAKIIHVDPRFTRTSAMADIHAHIRAGSDIAFLGGFVNFVLNHPRWNSEPFFRTPKQGQRAAIVRALSAAREELLLMVSLWLAAFSVSRIPLMDSPDLTVWQFALVIQSVPYAAAVIMSLVSALRLPASLIGVAGERQQPSHAGQSAAGSLKPVLRAPVDD